MSGTSGRVSALLHETEGPVSLRAVSNAATPGLVAAGCGLLALCLYVLTVARGAGWDDAGELAAGVARLGIVHGPGYPLYVSIGWVFTLLEPFGSRAVRANLWSAVAAAASVATIAYVVEWRTRDRVAGLVSAGLLATGDLFWSQAIQASVYPLFVLSILLLLLAAYRWHERPSPAGLAWLMAALGMVTVSHRTGFVFAPFVAVLVLGRMRRDALKRANLIASLAFFAPWLSVLYLPLRASARVVPNHLRGNPQGWWDLTTAAGQSHDRLFGAGAGLVVNHAVNVGLLAIADLSLAAVVLVPVGLWSLRRDRVFLLCGVAPAAVSGVLVATTISSYVYWQFPLLLVGAIAAASAIPSIRRQLVGRGTAVRMSALAVLAGASLTGAAAGAAYVFTHDPDSSPWAHAVLAKLPRGASVWAPWPSYTALHDVQELGQFRSDVHVLYYGNETVWSPSDLKRAVGNYVVGLSAVSAPAGIRLIPVGPAAQVERKGLTGLEFAGRVLGDATQYVAQMYRVQRSP
jgi:hypothetical protein